MLAVQVEPKDASAFGGGIQMKSVTGERHAVDGPVEEPIIEQAPGFAAIF